MIVFVHITRIHYYLQKKNNKNRNNSLTHSVSILLKSAKQMSLNIKLLNINKNYLKPKSFLLAMIKD